MKDSFGIRMSDASKAKLKQLLQSKGISRTMLENQLAKAIVVSYPVRSVSGKEKGMAKFYREQFYELMSGSAWHINELLFQSELVFGAKAAVAW